MDETRKIKKIFKNLKPDIIKERSTEKVKTKDYYNLLRNPGDFVYIPTDQNKIPKHQNKISSYAAQNGFKVKTEKLYIANTTSMNIEAVIKVTLIK